MNVIVVGSGAREHAGRILQSPIFVKKYFVFLEIMELVKLQSVKISQPKRILLRNVLKLIGLSFNWRSGKLFIRKFAGELRNKGLNVFGPDSEGTQNLNLQRSS